jgi:dienelactone hydrolase
MDALAFGEFRRTVIAELERSLGLEGWATRPVAERFTDRTLSTIVHDGVRMEVHAIEIRPSGLVVPVVVCLPPGEATHPAVVVLSGHSTHGLRDLVLDLDSYQRGVATRLARAGFVAAAVEKIDSGYLATTFGSGSDEDLVAALHLGLGTTTRTEQIRAALAASEVLAAHPRVDATRMGAAGVSLGGWLAIQTALLDDRIGAVADFGRKTIGMPPVDPCHVLPGLLALGERNVLTLAYAPRPLLAGHGRKDADSARQGPRHYEKPLLDQYAALGHADRLEYRVHDGGDVMPDEWVVAYFLRVLASPARPTEGR